MPRTQSILVLQGAVWVLLRAVTPLHLVLLIAVALLVFGPKRLPELGGAFGKTLQEFRKGMNHDAAAAEDKTGSGPARPN